MRPRRLADACGRPLNFTVRPPTLERSLVTFWMVVCFTIWLLKRRPDSLIARAAFTWVGPRPLVGQSWATFQARWAMYSFAWLCQIALVFSALRVIASRAADVDSAPWFLGFAFALSLGAGVALLATLGFLFKAAKARYIGLNPTWNPPPDDHTAA